MAGYAQEQKIVRDCIRDTNVSKMLLFDAVYLYLYI